MEMKCELQGQMRIFLLRYVTFNNNYYDFLFIMLILISCYEKAMLSFCSCLRPAPKKRAANHAPESTYILPPTPKRFAVKPK